MATSTAEATSSNAPEKTPAQILQEKHDAAERHNATVEEVVDEEDIVHPPPSSLHGQHSSTRETSPGGGNGHASERAAGKQKAQDPRPESSAPDTKSEEAFPALGSGLKSRGPAFTPGAAWSSRKATPAKPANINASLNGSARPQSTSSPVSSGASTPPSGVFTPASTSAPVTARGRFPELQKIPGKYQEIMDLQSSQLDKTKSSHSVLNDIKKRSGVTVTMTTIPGGKVRCTANGPKEQVRGALQRVAKELGIKQKVKVEVPASVKQHIIGKRGATIEGIMKKTGARIQVPRTSEASALGDDESATINVEIEGDPHSAEMARQEIEQIAKEKSSHLKLRLKEIPPEFFPFIAGPNNSLTNVMEQDKDLRITVPPFHTWQHQPPPRISQSNERPAFVPHSDMHIQLHGDRAAVQEARAQIEQQAEQLMQQLVLEEQAFQRGQHQFIIGERGMSPHDFLQETGCIVILPPDHDETEDVTIIGPPERLPIGVDRATTLASEMLSSSVDPRRHFSNAPLGQDAYARGLARYLQDRKIVEELNELYNSQLAFSSGTNSAVNWDIYSRDQKSLNQARSDLTKIIQAHPPSKFTLLEVDSFFHPHLLEQCAHSLRNDLGVHMVIPRDGESDHVVLVYEGPPQSDKPPQVPRQRPSNAETTAFEEALRQAQNQILSVIGDQEDINARNIEVPRKFHDKVRRFVDRQQQPKPPQGFPVEVVFGEPGGLPETAFISPDPIAGPSHQNGISLRGPGGSVSDLEKKILEFLAEAEQDEVERRYTTSFDFPVKFNNYLIGRSGAKINELREQFDVDIKILEGGKVEIKGKEAHAEACKLHILSLGRKWEEEVTYNIKIEAQFHRDLIGRKGEDVRKLENKYDVRIQFPRTVIPNDDQSVADAASEGGGSRHPRSNQAADEIVIRGPRQGADKARSEILELYQYFKDNSFTATVSVAKKQVPSLMGKGGSEMDLLRSETAAQVDVPGGQDTTDVSGRVEIKIKGSKQAVDSAKAELQRRAMVFDAKVVRTIEVDKKYHQSLIGANGSNIRRLVVEAGGPEKSAQAVKFPSRESDSSSVRIEGTAAVVDKIAAEIMAFVLEKENQVTESVAVPLEKHRMLIGPGGDTRRNLEQRFKVAIDIPRNGSGRTEIKISGANEEVSKAKEYIATLTKEAEGETINVPKSVHHTMAQNGGFFKKLRSDHKVTVDHGGRRPPPRAENDAQRARTNGTAPPLITDESNADAFSWNLVESMGVNDDSGTIPWILKGPSAESVAAAKALIEEALRSASQPSATGYLILPDPQSHRTVIGKGGRTINRIREETGCTIQVPKAGRSDDREAIEIVGSKQNCEQAKDLILEAVRDG